MKQRLTLVPVYSMYLCIYICMSLTLSVFVCRAAFLNHWMGKLLRRYKDLPVGARVGQGRLHMLMLMLDCCLNPNL